jgi:hypothetical protein
MKSSAQSHFSCCYCAISKLVFISILVVDLLVDVSTTTTTTTVKTAVAAATAGYETL